MKFLSTMVDGRDDDSSWLDGMGGPEQWRPADAMRVLDAWGQSGMSLAAFSAAHGIGVQRIAWWRKRLQDRTSSTTPTLNLKAHGGVPHTAPISIVMPGGSRIEVVMPDNVSPAWLAALVAALGRSEA